MGWVGVMRLPPPPFIGGIHFLISSVSNIMKWGPRSAWGTQFFVVYCLPSTRVRSARNWTALNPPLNPAPQISALLLCIVLLSSAYNAWCELRSK